MPVTTRLTTLNLSYDSQIKKFAYKSAFILNSAVEHGDDCIYNKYPNTAFIPIPMNKIKMNVMYDMFMKYFKQYNTTNAYNSKFYAVSTWSAGVDGVTIIAVAEFPCEKKGTESEWYCDWEGHENTKLLHDGDGGWICPDCDYECKYCNDESDDE